MLCPKDLLFVYGVENPIPQSKYQDLRSFYGIIDDAQWSYLICTEDTRLELHNRGLSIAYEATLQYEQWLDGDCKEPIKEAGITIVPPWCEAPPLNRTNQVSQKIISIYPSLVFGTGAHPTTRRCLRLLVELFQSKTTKIPKDVLDLGCGTGVLGIAALQLGANKVYGCDISKLAIETAQKNGHNNGVYSQMTFFNQPASETIIPADLVLANLPPTALEEILHHPSLLSSQYIIISGMLKSSADRIVNCMSEKSKEIDVYIDGPWHTIFVTYRE